jgi:hypothetical protein
MVAGSVEVRVAPRRVQQDALPPLRLLHDYERGQMFCVHQAAIDVFKRVVIHGWPLRSKTLSIWQTFRQGVGGFENDTSALRGAKI